VLSKSVADGLSYYGDPATKATEKFCRLMDRFFDCLNVRCMDAWREKKKNDLKPYTDPNDERLKVAMIASINYCNIISMHAWIVVRRGFFEILEGLGRQHNTEIPKDCTN